MYRLTTTHVSDRPRPSLRFSLAVATLGIVLAACTSAAGPSAAPAGAASGTAATSSVGSTDGGGGSGGSAGDGFVGSLASSGVYAATWTVSPDLEVRPFTGESVTIVSDKGTFGNIEVSPEGNVSFGSGAPELSQYGQFTGSGAKVTLDPNNVGNSFVCAFTVDNDLKSSRDGSVMLHLAGSLVVHWHPSGLGGINCP